MTGAALAAVVSIGGSLSAADAEQGSVIRRTAWSFDRSEINWNKGLDPAELNVDEAKIEEKKKNGIIDEMRGWAEYDVVIPATGWYEVWQGGTGGRVFTLRFRRREGQADGSAADTQNLAQS